MRCSSVVNVIRNYHNIIDLIMVNYCKGECVSDNNLQLALCAHRHTKPYKQTFILTLTITRIVSFNTVEYRLAHLADKHTQL